MHYKAYYKITAEHTVEEVFMDFYFSYFLISNYHKNIIKRMSQVELIIIIIIAAENIITSVEFWNPAVNNLKLILLIFEAFSLPFLTAPFTLTLSTFEVRVMWVIMFSIPTVAHPLSPM